MANSNTDRQVYLVEDIIKILGISRNTAYNFIKDAPFPVLKIKSTYRIPKEAFDRWHTTGDWKEQN
jgi:excisionase family DNA binding protein